MSRLIVVGTRKTGSSLALVRAALDRNLDVTVIGGPDDALQGVFPAHVEIVGMPRHADVIAAWIREHYPDPDRSRHVTTANDAYAAVAAAVADTLRLPGPDVPSVVRAASKVQQKALLADCGIPSAECIVVRLSDLPACRHQLDDLRFPAVIKPVGGTAGYGVRRCDNRHDVLEHLASLSRDAPAEARSESSEEVIIETFLEGSEYCVEYFDGRYVGALRKLKRYGDGFLERGYTSELDIDDSSLRRLIDCGTEAVVRAGLTWGPVHLDCIVSDGRPHIVEINPRMAGSFICDIVRDAYGFDAINRLLDKLEGKRVVVPELYRPGAFARVDFLLDSDPAPWDYTQPGELKNGDLHISYGPQRLPSRRRRAYLYLHSPFQPEARRASHAKVTD
ncbi:carboxylate--amine ligase [Burkholderia cepacia]|uniref:ATP-grasp domain-containing protein n=1 Tax=Burkholderia cepacia TaxID=292 RepID=UPI00075A436F|nr:ATP-grasp domain-containing protein [Burkholderia cepacia]KVL56368.1 carboxylate--amine ligase [Burkholderia cepacia]